MNLDTLVSIGQPPWEPVPGAELVDVWDKYDFPICGIYRLGDDLIVFTLITTAGSRSLWAYVPVPPGEREAVTEVRFDHEDEFDAFLKGCFAGREAVFASAGDFVITAKSDGIFIPAGKNELLAVATGWYIGRRFAGPVTPARGAVAGDADTLLSVAQRALANLPG